MQDSQMRTGYGQQKPTLNMDSATRSIRDTEQKLPSSGHHVHGATPWAKTPRVTFGASEYVNDHQHEYRALFGQRSQW